MSEAETKQAMFTRLLEQGVTALHLDPRRLGVQVPRHLADRPWLVLNYSYHYHIDDFTFDDREVLASLSFQGAPHMCRVPWQAVFGITDGSQQVGRLWEDDLPPEVVAQQQAVIDAAEPPRPLMSVPDDSAARLDDEPGAALEAAPMAARPNAEAATAPDASTRAGLRVLDGGSDDDPTPTEPRRGHLRRIK